MQKWKIKNPTLRIVRISAKRVLWEKNCSCFDSVLMILTSRDLVHTFELGSREFQSYDCEFKSDRNIFSNLLEIVMTNRIRKVFVVHSQVHNSKKGDHAPKWFTFVIGFGRSCGLPSTLVNRITWQRYFIFSYIFLIN